MGLFDGPIRGFAIRLCGYLDERAKERVTESQDTADPYSKLRAALVGEILSEVSHAIKTVAGL